MVVDIWFRTAGEWFRLEEECEAPARKCGSEKEGCVGAFLLKEVLRELDFFVVKLLLEELKFTQQPDRHLMGQERPNHAHRQGHPPRKAACPDFGWTRIRLEGPSRVGTGCRTWPIQVACSVSIIII